MTAARFGLLIGSGLAVVWAALGFGAFVGAALAGLLGSAVGALLEGRLDVLRLADVLSRRRASS